MPRATKVAYSLSDAEKRDLTELIQAGRPLPKKYRFILFEDKREVELVWNGKLIWGDYKLILSSLKTGARGAQLNQ
jgi:hypothetical protein